MCLSACLNVVFLHVCLYVSVFAFVLVWLPDVKLCGYDLFRVNWVTLVFKVLRASMVHQDLRVQWADTEDRETEVIQERRVTKDTGYVPVSSVYQRLKFIILIIMLFVAYFT